MSTRDEGRESEYDCVFVCVCQYVGSNWVLGGRRGITFVWGKGRRLLTNLNLFPSTTCGTDVRYG